MYWVEKSPPRQSTEIHISPEPRSYDWHPYGCHVKADGEEVHVTTEDKDAEGYSYKPGGAKYHQQTPEARREAQNRFSLGTAEEGLSPTNTLISDL